MASDATPEEKTELPTDRRMAEYRKVGDIFLSNELVLFVTLGVGFLTLSVQAHHLGGLLQGVMRESFHAISKRTEFTLHNVGALFFSLLSQIIPQVSLFAVMISIGATLAVMLQTGWNVKEKKFDFRLDGLNPVRGIMRIVSLNGFVTTGKALVKLLLFLVVGVVTLKASLNKVLLLGGTSLSGIASFLFDESFVIVWRLLGVLFILTVFDYFYGRYRWLRDHRMTKDEVKDERKSVEGDEATKREIIQKGMRRIRQRLTVVVPQADVVITNPTHYAIAIKYDRVSQKAPTILAKGSDELALRIREIAKEAGVPLVERKELARALYRSVKIGGEIPHELYKAVAEVLAYVYSLKRPKMRQSGERI
jgi:flagellar biosynthesis protein FlhB